MGLGHRTSRGDPQALGAWGDSGTGSRYQEESGGVRSCRGPSAMLARPGGASGTPVARGLYHVEPSDWSRAAKLAWRSRGTRSKSAGSTLWSERSRQVDPQLHTPQRRQERCGAPGRDRVSIICPTPSESPTRAGDALGDRDGARRTWRSGRRRARRFPGHQGSEEEAGQRGGASRTMMGRRLKRGGERRGRAAGLCRTRPGRPESPPASRRGAKGL